MSHEKFRLWIGCGRYQEYPDGFLCFIEPHEPFVRKLLGVLDAEGMIKQALGVASPACRERRCSCPSCYMAIRISATRRSLPDSERCIAAAIPPATKAAMHFKRLSVATRSYRLHPVVIQVKRDQSARPAVLWYPWLTESLADDWQFPARTRYSAPGATPTVGRTGRRSGRVRPLWRYRHCTPSWTSAVRGLRFLRQSAL